MPSVAVGGNSAMVEAGWLQDPANREAARRLTKVVVEALAIFHQDREIAINTMMKWYGIEDRDQALAIYKRGRYLEKKPYPCLEGIDNTFAVYDSSEMRKYTPADFYDDSFVRELDESGFIVEVYGEGRPGQ